MTVSIGDVRHANGDMSVSSYLSAVVVVVYVDGVFSGFTQTFDFLFFSKFGTLNINPKKRY